MTSEERAVRAVNRAESVNEIKSLIELVFFQQDIGIVMEDYNTLDETGKGNVAQIMFNNGDDYNTNPFSAGAADFRNVFTDAVSAQINTNVVTTAKSNLTVTVTDSYAANSTISLPTSQDGAEVTWLIIQGSGSITPWPVPNPAPSTLTYNTPARAGVSQTAVLEATITKGSESDTKTFTVTIADNANTNTEDDPLLDNATSVATP